MGQTVLTNFVVYIIDPATLLIFSLGFLVFIWGLVEFVRDPANQGTREKGKQHMIWGIVGMFIMISAASIINIIDDTFDLNIRGTATPSVQGRSGTGSNPGFDSIFR